jgi:hypothetical protein
MGKFRSRKIPGFGPVRRARRHLISPQLAKPLPERARPLSVPHSRIGEFSLSAELTNYYRGPLARSACPIPKLASSRLGRAHRRSEVPGNLPSEIGGLYREPSIGDRRALPGTFHRRSPMPTVPGATPAPGVATPGVEFKKGAKGYLAWYGVPWGR